MARVSGVDIPDNKRGVISLTYIFGLGKSSSVKILEMAGVDADKKLVSGLMTRLIVLELS